MKTFIGVILLSCLGINIIAQKLPDWEEGMMDIHHINTGRGDAAFLILPDGTTFLIDAGDMINLIEQKTGHIVIRVHPGGDNYSVYILDDNSIDYSILLQNNYDSR